MNQQRNDIDMGVVLVTYNRINELKKAIEKYNEQTYLPQYILIVNNNSTDGTKEFLEKWENTKANYKKYVINLKENIGGSGGFYTGLEKAKTLDAKWIWVADDDAFPQRDAFEKLNELFNEIDFSNYSAICGEIINNGKIDFEHRRRIKKGVIFIQEYNVPQKEYEKKYFNIDLFSYVGTVINQECLQKCGSTRKDFFIYYDDTEHSYRLRKDKPIICVPSVKINHNTINSNNITWKIYYGSRNKMIFIKNHFPKRYFYAEYIKQYILQNLKIIIKKLIKKQYISNVMTLEGIKDAKNGKTNLHKVYRPGWKYEGDKIK